MNIQVKICGIRTRDTLDAVISAGADYFGLVFFPPSPRNVDIATAGELAEAARGSLRSVALFVNPSDEELARVVAEVAPDMIQLHGSEDAERVSDVRKRFGRPVIKAVKVATVDEVSAGLSMAEVADLVLFDAKPPKGQDGALPGGNGLTFDWRILTGIEQRMPFMLSGGLTPENVACAIALTGASAVDVSSGVERTPGEKDATLIRRFVEQARRASQQKATQDARSL